MKLIYWLIALALLSVSANAQGVIMMTQLQCNLTGEIVKQLGLTYKETAVGAGLNSRGYQVRLFVSKSNTFTVLVTRPEGISCIAASGDDWTLKPLGDDL